MLLNTPALLVCAGMLNLTATKTVWMNQVIGYSSLPPCAKNPVSVIVRDMSYGCGDNNAVTSQDCFCTASYSHFNSFISKAVAGQCSDGAAQASNAVGVFEKYCAQVRIASSQAIQTAGFNVSSPSTRSSASPASTGTTFIPLPTTPTTTSPPPGISSGAAIVVQESNILLGVAVGIVVFNAL